MERQLRESAVERFDYLGGVASGGCMDVDMLLERNGWFLAIENKHPGEAMPRGQEIALTALARQEKWTVWIVHGTPPDNIVSAGKFGGEQMPMTVERLRANVQRWWDAHSREALAVAA